MPGLDTPNNNWTQTQRHEEERSGHCFATRSNLHLIALFSHPMKQRKSRKTCIHASRQVWYLIVLYDPTRKPNPRRKKRNERFIHEFHVHCFFFMQYYLHGLFVFTKGTTPEIQLLFFFKKHTHTRQVFMELFSLLLHFWEGKEWVTT